ncbi:MAG: transcriptional regulator [Clostridia bacterium]|nr:transcriptional regulator [Clostridia bacterium]
MRDNIEKTILFGELFALYGKLLSSTQESVMKDYYDNDLTLTEIAENGQISRQAVYDAVVKAQKNLLEIEEKVGAYAKIKKLKNK